MKLGQIITEYRREHSMSQRQFAEKCGNLTNGYVSMLENDRNPATGKPIIPSLDKLKSIASTMGITLQRLLDEADDLEVKLEAPPRDNLYSIRAMKPHRVPLIGSVACGQPILAEESYEVFVDSPSKADYALKVEGDSMEPQYQEGDIVYIRAQDDCDDGQVAVVLLDDSAALKHIYHIQDGLQLISNNPAYPPKTVTVPQYDTIRILGIPCGFTRMYK